MKLQLVKQYKALTPFESPDLPKLVVLTGKNGSGKSQLLELLRYKDPTLDPKVARQKPPEVDSLKISNFTPKQVKLTTLGNGGPQGLANANKAALDQLDQSLIGQIQNYKSAGDKTATYEFRMLDKIREFHGVSITELTADHVKTYRYSGEDFEVKDIFTANIAHIVISYFENFHKNLEMTVAAQQYKKDVKYLTAEQFEAAYPNPFKIVNDVLETAQIDYRLLEEKVEKYYTDKTYAPKFTNIKSKAEVTINDFSSGERVLLSLAFSILNTERFSSKSLPNLLLLDEIDASLHPSMVKQLLSVIQKHLVDKHKIQVILTTHSPSTVALAPEESIFLLRKFGEEGERFIKTTKKNAINQLLDGVRSIDIDTKNIKHVFTESRTDEYFLRSIYSALRDKFSPDVHLEFISSGIYDGNCELVQATVTKLREAGNRRVYGIIDWDNKNAGKDGIYVQCENERYSIENIVYCPLFLGLMLFHENIVKIEDVFAGENRPYFEFFKNNLTNEKLNILSKFITGKIFEPNNTEEALEVELIGGFKVSLSSTYLKQNGHALESQITSKIPELKRFNGAGVLLKETINRVIKNFPELLSKKTVETLLNIQNSD